LAARRVEHTYAALQQAQTALQRSHAEMELSHTELEKRVAERTTELQAANDVALETVRLKSEFISTMSHELRTPLNAIHGFCGIMLEGMGGEIDHDAHVMVERINANSERLLLLINQILELARMEAGRMELVAAPL